MRPVYSGLHAAVRNPLVCGRKFCAECGRWRLALDFRPDRHNTGSGLRSYCLACERIRKRRKRERMTEDQRERHREYQRIWAEVRRRQAGTPERVFYHRARVTDRYERILLPTTPLLEHVEWWIAAQRENGDGDYNYNTLCRAVGIDEASLRRLRSGESRRVRIDLADRICQAMDVPLTLLYPLEGVR